MSPASADLDGFLAFIRTQGAVEVPALTESAELIRFTIGQHVGIVSRRKDGTLTFAGVARPMLERMTANNRAALAPDNGADFK